MEEQKHILEENKKLRRLQLMVDLQIQILYQRENLDLSEGLRIIGQTRNYAISLFPGKENVFNLIYRPRMMRVLEERGIIGYSNN
ncbi:MAG TPA: hypothetical protein ENK14_08325 [Caldithrix sp.]|nr:hypothetical protein [Caldithrix sp.]